MENYILEYLVGEKAFNAGRWRIFLVNMPLAKKEILTNVDL